MVTGAICGCVASGVLVFVVTAASGVVVFMVTAASGVVVFMVTAASGVVVFVVTAASGVVVFLVTAASGVVVFMVTVIGGVLGFGGGLVSIRSGCEFGFGGGLVSIRSGRFPDISDCFRPAQNISSLKHSQNILRSGHMPTLSVIALGLDNKQNRVLAQSHTSEAQKAPILIIC